MSHVKHALFLTLMTPVFTGCATLWPSKLTKDETPEKPEAKREELVGAFDAKRDIAQFDAAKARWQEGDTAGCKELVGKILVRNPKHRGGRLLRAELQLVDGKAELAVAEIQSLVDENPQDAEASHMLGLLLEATGQLQEALSHFERAAQIAPENRVFATSYQSALVGEPSLDVEGVVATDSPKRSDHRTIAGEDPNGFHSTSVARKTRDIKRPKF
jgi:tetratricopeptide (TPR) repeat protein